MSTKSHRGNNFLIVHNFTTYLVVTGDCAIGPACSASGVMRLLACHRWPRVPFKPACRLLLSRAAGAGSVVDFWSRASRRWAWPRHVHAPPGRPARRARRRGPSCAPGDPHPPPPPLPTPPTPKSCHPVPEFRGASFFPPAHRPPKNIGRTRSRPPPPTPARSGFTYIQMYNNILSLLLLFSLYFTN